MEAAFRGTTSLVAIITGRLARKFDGGAWQFGGMVQLTASEAKPRRATISAAGVMLSTGFFAHYPY